MLETREFHEDNMGEIPNLESDIAAVVGEFDIRDDGEHSDTGPSTSGTDNGDNYTDDEIDTIVEKERQEMVNRIVRRFSNLPAQSSRIYRSDVIATNNHAERLQLLRLLEFGAERYPSQFFFVSEHGDHLHIIHDCAKGNNSCRCPWKTKVEGAQATLRKRKRVRAPVYIGSLTEESWKAIILYFTSNGRHGKIFVLGGRIQRLQNGIANLEPRRRSKRGTSQLMEICDGEDSPELQQAFPNISSIGKGKRARNDITRAERETRKQRISNKIERLIMKHPVCPLISICDIDEYLEDDDLKTIRADNQIVKDVIDYMGKRFCRYTLHDYNVFYKRPDCIPHFSAGYRDFDDKYMNIEDTRIIIRRLLMHQCNDDIDVIKGMLLSLYNIIERKIPKTNTFLIHGPPSSGKNFFIDMILSYLLNTGQFGIANRHNGFSFQDGHGKRAILWDELNYSQDMLDLIKMITGGGDCKVRVKNKHDCPLSKTPLICLTNRVVSIMNDSAFIDRLLKYFWREAPFLKECDKLPNPLYTFEMFIDYGIITV